MCLITPDKSRPMCLIVYLFYIEKMWAMRVVSGEGLAPIVSAYSRLILVDGTVL